MLKWRSTIVSPEGTIQDAINSLTDSGMQICLVCDVNGILLGTVTDGDIRRGIIQSLPLDAKIRQVMNPAPHVSVEGSDDSTNIMLMSTFGVRAVPIVDTDRKVVGLRIQNDIMGFDQPKDNPVVIMAGGLGKRLRPVTDDLPKPLVSVGNKPLLETIIQGLQSHGFYNIYISVNYKSEMIKDYFGNGDSLGVSIRYLEEDERMGTAGALRLLPREQKHPVIVMNGDLLTSVNFEALLDYHLQQKSSATMCVRQYEFQIPFGVIDIDHHEITGISEKPIKQYLVNAGIYVLNPDMLEYIPPGGLFDMTELFGAILREKKMTAVFPIREYWLDVGRMTDLEKANWAYEKEFSS